MEGAHFMLSQHVHGRCAGGALEVRGGDKMSAFYAESACVCKVHTRCVEGDGGDKKSAFYAESACV